MAKDEGKEAARGKQTLRANGWGTKWIFCKWKEQPFAKQIRNICNKLQINGFSELGGEASFRLALLAVAALVDRALIWPLSDNPNQWIAMRNSQRKLLQNSSLLGMDWHCVGVKRNKKAGWGFFCYCRQKQSVKQDFNQGGNKGRGNANRKTLWEGTSDISALYYMCKSIKLAPHCLQEKKIQYKIFKISRSRRLKGTFINSISSNLIIRSET